MSLGLDFQDVSPGWYESVQGGFWFETLFIYIFKRVVCIHRLENFFLQCYHRTSQLTPLPCSTHQCKWVLCVLISQCFGITWLRSVLLLSILLQLPCYTWFFPSGINWGMWFFNTQQWFAWRDFLIVKWKGILLWYFLQESINYTSNIKVLGELIMFVTAVQEMPDIGVCPGES